MTALEALILGISSSINQGLVGVGAGVAGAATAVTQLANLAALTGAGINTTLATDLGIRNRAYWTVLGNTLLVLCHNGISHERYSSTNGQFSAILVMCDE
ncbi:MAG: hypothetical protein JWR37_1986 [Mycobacterium sp.]|nr:hypothetical protein [Mycobacterium sp.]